MSLVVVSATGPISIQGPPQHGHMHEGVPPGGAVRPALLAAANRALGNRDDAPAIEVLGRLVLRDERGDDHVIEAQTWTYVAVRGELAAPLVTTPLRKGDRLAGTAIHVARGEVSPLATVRVIPGPDRDAFEPAALAALCRTPYAVAMPARTGARLDGPRIARLAGHRERSRPMVQGAIEVPGDGVPIVLGPDHPTTGGYPVLAVVAADDVERVFAGKQVQFTT
jgi:allophanate hydrolase subunit 2